MPSLTQKQIIMEEHFKLLGKKATDSITGFRGEITAITFYLYQTTQCLLETKSVNNKEPTTEWIPLPRLTIEH